MNPGSVVAIAVIAVIAPFVLTGIRRRREAIRLAFRRAIITEMCYFAAVVLFAKAGAAPLEAVLAGLVAAFMADRFIPSRSRYVKRSERKKAIARYESKTKRKFNRRIHHIDHVVPFSKGGGGTADNLQVLERKENLAKGSRTPWWDLVG